MRILAGDVGGTKTRLAVVTGEDGGFRAERVVTLASGDHTDLPYVPTSPLHWPPILHEMGLGKPKDSAHTHKIYYTAGAVLMEDEVAKWDYAVIP